MHTPGTKVSDELHSMIDEHSCLLRFSRSEWPLFVSSVANAADVVRSAISSRHWDDALAASVELSAVCSEVEGMARSVDVEAPRPVRSVFETFESLSNDPVLGLALPNDSWAEVVSSWAFLRLAVEWEGPFDLVAAALCGPPLEWPALRAELEQPGTHPEMRIAEDFFGTDRWRRVEEIPSGYEASAFQLAVAGLSSEARSVLATLGGLRQRRSVVELRMVAHTMKLSEDRLVSALRELESRDLAEFPASFETLANELTGAHLKVLATEAGVKRSGNKADLVRRLIDAGAVDPLADAINRRGYYHPVALGPTADSFAAQRAWAGLWTALWESTNPYGPLDEATELLQEQNQDAVEANEWDTRPDTPEGARWQFELAAPIVDDLVVDGLFVFATAEGSVHALASDGIELWDLHIGESSPEYSSASLFETPHGLCVVTSKAVRFLGVADGRGSWTWRSPHGPLVQQPVVANGCVYVVTDDGLHAITVGGEEIWRFEGKSLGNPAADAETVVVTGAGKVLNSLDAATGELLHQRSLEDLPRTWSPLLSNGIVLLSGYRDWGWLSVALDARSGTTLWLHNDELMEGLPWEPPPASVVEALRKSSTFTGLPLDAREARDSLTVLFETGTLERTENEDEALHYEARGRLKGCTYAVPFDDQYMVATDRTLWALSLDDLLLAVGD